MYKIAVLGDRESVLGFKALGLDVIFAETAEEARRQLHRLVAEEYSIIYVTEQLAQGMMADINKYKTLPSTAVILIPGKSGSLGIGTSSLQSAVERAVGTNIL